MKSYIICLSKISESVKTATHLKNQLEQFKMPAELFEGTYGSDAEEIFTNENRTVHPVSFKGLEVDERYSNKAKRPGVMGCFYSHYRLWKKCVELDETICVFEDDVKIYRELIPVDFTDVLVLTLGARKSEKYKQYLTDPVGKPKAEQYHNSSMPGTTGYLISPQGAKKLLETYKQTFLASDNAMNTMVIDIKIHNYLVGTANIDKKSLTKASKFWKEFK
jgi:glycosyl transferase family 25